MITRSQLGIVKPLERLSLNAFSIYPIPKNLSDALKYPQWRNAMYDEYNALIKNGTWTLVPRTTELLKTYGIRVQLSDGRYFFDKAEREYENGAVIKLNQVHETVFTRMDKFVTDVKLVKGFGMTSKLVSQAFRQASRGTSALRGSLHAILPPEWSKFVTGVKLVKDLHTSNFDQLHAYIEQHELHANEVRIMRERNQDPLAFVSNQQMTPPHFNLYQSSYNNPQLQQQFSPSQYGSIQHNQHCPSSYPSQQQFTHSSIPPSNTYQSQMNHQTTSVPKVIPQVAYQSPPAPTQLMTESPFVASGFAVPVFSPGDDPIACLNKVIAFAVASSRFPTTNNQLRSSSNLRNQATIQDGRVTVQQVQGRQGQNYSGTAYKSNATTSRGNTASG
ncbi:retrovirus-related pol polyprotein from transposon TNT 1-94 [Tanacetum coccineum]